MKFFIFGDPKGQPRTRAFARRMGTKYVARVYDSDVADAWKSAVDHGITLHLLAYPVIHDASAAFNVRMQFFFRRPKSHLTADGRVKSSAPLLHISKPDADNLAKLVLDRITRCGRIWRDDSQVVTLIVHKVWTSGNESGCAVLISAEGI